MGLKTMQKTAIEIHKFKTDDSWIDALTEEQLKQLDKWYKANSEEISIYNRIAKTTAELSIGVMVHDGDELIVNLREELR